MCRTPPAAAAAAAAVVALGLLLAAQPAAAAVRSYALVVGVNTSVDQGVEPLHFADDDAAKYARLFDRLADQTWLLTLFDADSRVPYKDLLGRARAPERLELERAVAELRAAAAREHRAGNTVVAYFVYVGHGARDKASGEGYVNLTDQKLTRSQLHRLLIDAPADPASRFDRLHVIVDACSAYFVVHERGAAGLSPVAGADYSGRMGELFGPPAAGAEKSPHVGYLLATTGDAKVHEWSAYRGGVFSHLVRSALSGAADVDLDGRVSYAEAGAFIVAASGTIEDPRARLDVTVAPPPAEIEAPLAERNRFRPRQLVLLDARMAGHYLVETEAGERLLDLHKPKGLAAVFAVWGASRYYLSGREGETVLDFSSTSVIASAPLVFGASRRGERGAIDEQYRKALFSRPYDVSFYRAYCSLLRLPAREPPSRPLSPEDLMAEAELAAAPASPASPAAPAGASLARPAGARPRVAVLYFSYDGQDAEMAVLRKGLAAMLISDLGVSADLTIVERERLQDVLDELKLNQSAKVDQATAVKVGKLLGAQYLVMGNYFDFKGTFVLTARIVDTETGARLHSDDSLRAQGRAEDFLQLEQKIAGQLADGLARIAPRPSSKGSEGPPASPTTAPRPKRLPGRTALRFAKALDAIDRKDRETARKELEVVVHEQPDFRLAAAELASLVR